jgi:hypothetical protein
VHVLRKLRLEDRAAALETPPAPPDGALDGDSAEALGDDSLGDDLWPASSGHGGPRP